jgi:hypothetical protein
VPASHVDPLQHPEGHDVGSQTQAPDTQRCPAPQAGPAPQRHAPEAHPSPRAPQSVQAPPPPPHWAAEGLVTQLPPLQHPDGHEVASHTHCPP